jgi:hypothetical protein
VSAIASVVKVLLLVPTRTWFCVIDVKPVPPCSTLKIPDIFSNVGLALETLIIPLVSETAVTNWFSTAELE